MAIMLFVMSVVLGISTFAVGMLPLLYSFSKSHLERLSALGTGLLLGTALGVIIPEGLEVMAAAHKDGLPTTRIALCLVIGFILMLIIEQLISPHSHSHPPTDSMSPLPSRGSTLNVEFDAELGSLGLGNPSGRRPDLPSTPGILEPSAEGERAFALLLGLVIHGIADGFALGIAHVAGSSTGGTKALPLVVFFALLLHKAPTTFAFATSIISTNIPRSQCKKYLIIFSLSTPLSALMTYAICSFLGNGDKGDLTGITLLVSGGTFLYVATVLQPVSQHSHMAGDMRATTRVSITVLGMFIPLVIRALFNHDH